MVKLTLENYRCHKKSVINIPDEGLILLSGPNEIGKTTIFKALMFLLYDVGRNHCTYGTTGCSVTLHQKSENGLHTILVNRVIARPKRLQVVLTTQPSKVSRTFEGSDAQAVINKFVGAGLKISNTGFDFNAPDITYSQFNAASYVIETQRNSVISMNSADQLKFIENIVYENDIHHKCKVKVKDYIKKRREDLLKCEGVIMSLEQNLLSKKERVKEVRKILGVSASNEGNVRCNITSTPSLKQIKKIKASIQAKIGELNRKLEGVQSDQSLETKKYKRLEDDESRRNVVVKQIDKLTTEVGVYKNKLESYGELPSEDHIHSLEAQVDTLKESIKDYENFQKCQHLTERLKSQQKKVVDDLEEEIEKLSSQLLSTYELETLEAELGELEKYRDEMVDIIAAHTLQLQTAEKVLSDKSMMEERLSHLVLPMKSIRKYISLTTSKKRPIVKNPKIFEILTEFYSGAETAKREEYEKIDSIYKELIDRIRRENESKGSIYECPCCSKKLILDITTNTLQEYTLQGGCNVSVSDDTNSMCASTSTLTDTEPVRQPTPAKRGRKPKVKDVVYTDVPQTQPSEDVILQPLSDVSFSEKEELEKTLGELNNEISMYQSILAEIIDLKVIFDTPIPEVYHDIKPPQHDRIKEINRILDIDFDLVQKVGELSEKRDSILGNGGDIIGTPKELQELNRLKKSLPPKYIHPKKFDVDTTMSKISSISDLIKEKWRIRSEISIASREVSIREKELSKLNSSINHRQSSQGETKQTTFEKIKKLSEECSSLTKKIELQTSLLQETLDTESLVVVLNDIKEIEERLTLENDNANKIKKNIESALVVEEAAKEAEILSISKVISDINDNAKNYIDIFFSKDITVKIENVKTSVKGHTKLQLNTYVEDEGSQVDFSELSAGAKQKCELAFILGVNDMLGGRVVMLDESMNSCDSEIIVDIIDSLKNLQTQKDGYNKLVLVVGHHIPIGFFDHVINIGECKE